MNLMQHPRGGFSKSTAKSIVTKLVRQVDEVWIDELTDGLPKYSFSSGNFAVKSTHFYWNSCIIALKKWRKKKGIRR